MWPVESIARGVKGAIHRVERTSFSAISTDSRTIGPGEFFIPLKGPSFDGHLFIGEAYERSGGGSLCDRTRAEVYHKAPGTVILVDDTNQALLDLARFKREGTQATFVAVTGSNGKTTTKELLVHLAGGHVSLAFNEKNYNNQIGVAKALLAMEGTPQFCLLEIGTNHPGEIGVLARMVQPHMALITNVNPSHLEGFTDLDGVRREKLSLFDATLPDGTVFVNADDPSVASYKPKETVKAVTFGIREKADSTLRVLADNGLTGFAIVLQFPDGQVETQSPLVGRHNLYNVLAASVLAHAMGIPPDAIGEAVATFGAYKGRLRPIESQKGYLVIDDAYNANPSSMKWAVHTLSSLPAKGRRIAVLGGMKELGAQSEAYHRELGRILRDSDISMIVLLGEETEATAAEIGNGRAKHFSDKSALIDFLKGIPKRDDMVLVKGSHSMGMDEIVEALI
jgi:UDP-N-acetylmuramoyl-tripeptide--D-alanyl-D-alanine ligase